MLVLFLILFIAFGRSSIKKKTQSNGDMYSVSFTMDLVMPTGILTFL